MKKTPLPAEIRQPAEKAGNTPIARSAKAGHQFNPSQYPCWMFPTNHPPRW